MRDQGYSAAVEQDESTDRAIMDALIDDPGPWAVVELQRELLNPLAVKDGLARLAGVGMVHQIEGGFVFATRAAKQAAAIFEG